MGMFTRLRQHVPEPPRKLKHLSRKHLIILAGMAFGAASFSVDLDSGSFNAVRCALIFGAEVTAWGLWTRSNRQGRVLTLIAGALGFVLSGSPSSKGGTNGEQAWAALSVGTDIAQGLLGDRVKAVGAVVSAWLRAKGIA